MTRWGERTTQVLTGGVIAGAAAEFAVLECFLLPLRIGSVAAPLSIPAAALGNVGLPALAYRLTGSRALASLPVIVWVAVVALASLPRPEGDLIVAGTWRGVAFLLVGAVAGAYAVGRLLGAPRKRDIGGDSGR
jgi:hypothetical protein